MIILGIDPGTRMGFAYGAPGSKPRSGTVLLKKESEPADVAFANLIAFLQSFLGPHNEYGSPPNFIMKEAPLPFAGSQNKSVQSVRVTPGFHALIEGMARRYGIEWDEKHPDSICKHFTGRAHYGDRRAKKLAVIERCRQLGYGSNFDDNRADACAVWDYACAHVARVPPAELTMFAPQSQRRRKAS